MSSAADASMKIIANGNVITCDAQGRGGRLDLLIRDGRIMEISDRPDLFASLHPYATVIDASNKLIIPGFVNAHFHSESVLLCERTAGLHFSLWKRDIRLHEASQRLLSEESYADVRSLYQVAYFSHLKSGTTCVGEFPLSFNDKAFVQLLQAIDRTDVKTVVALQNWDQIRQARELGPRAPRFLLSLGREEDFTVYAFDNLLRAANEFKFPTVAHIAEQREDSETVKKNFQKNVFTVLRDYNTLSNNSLLIHMNHATAEEVHSAAEAGFSTAITPLSTARKQTGYPALRTLLEQGGHRCLGTDWGNTDMVKEMQFLHQLPFLIPGCTALAPLDILHMATINGATALGLEGETGSIEVGKKADLTFFSLNNICIPPVAMHPHANDLANLLLSSLNSRDISDVMINGDFYLTNHRLMTIDEEELIAMRQELQAKYFPGAKLRPQYNDEESARPRIIPLMIEPRTSTDAAEGFEEGFSVKPLLPDQDVSSQESERPQPRARRATVEPPKTQLSKDVRKVFGDDDEF